MRSLEFATAYRQLEPTERAFVDAVVADIEEDAVKSRVRLRDAMRAYKPAQDSRTLDMLSRALVRAAITDRINELSESAELNVYRTLKELRAIAYSSIGHYMEVDNNGQPSFDLSTATPEQLSAIKSIKITETSTVGREERKFEFVLHDKIAALDKVMRYQGLLDPDNAHWTAEKRTAAQALVTTTDSVESAADAYSRMING